MSRAWGVVVAEHEDRFGEIFYSAELVPMGDWPAYWTRTMTPKTQDLHEWCEGMFGAHNDGKPALSQDHMVQLEGRWSHPTTLTFRFRTRKDAMIFKLSAG